MMPRLLRAVGVIAILVLLYLPRSPISERSLPKIPWIILFIVALTYGISLCFNMELPAYRRFALAYLVFVGLTYLLAGVLGLLPNWDLIDARIWYSLVSRAHCSQYSTASFTLFPLTSLGCRTGYFPSPTWA